MGERGLKIWAKGASRTAIKQGRDKFTYSASTRVDERMLLNTVIDRLTTQEVVAPIMHSGVSKRRVPHFRYERIGNENSLSSLDRKGMRQTLTEQTGSIQPEILEAIFSLDNDNQQFFFDIWCEATLPSGQIVRCWPQYRGNQGCKYDWVLAKFELEDKGDEGDEPMGLLVDGVWKDQWYDTESTGGAFSLLA